MRMTATHQAFSYADDGLTNGAVVTHHFTRPEMARQYAAAMRLPPRAPLKREVYESEQVVIVEYHYND